MNKNKQQQQQNKINRIKCSVTQRKQDSKAKMSWVKRTSLGNNGPPEESHSLQKFYIQSRNNTHIPNSYLLEIQN